ncbi:MAG: hypothetical protein GDA48_03480 [Hormoscilla sp. GM102CHS1]|nr:hypothetical protein [Hormoscilla sp. GM102CHS1]
MTYYVAPPGTIEKLCPNGAIAMLLRSRYAIAPCPEKGKASTYWPQDLG